MDIGRLAKKVKAVVDTRGDKIASGIDKATDLVDKRTRGRYHDKLQKVDGLAGRFDKTKDRPAAAPDAPDAPERPGEPTRPA